MLRDATPLTSSLQDQIRDLARRNVLRLLETGPGIHAYTLHKAQRLEAEEADTHRGLVALVTTTLGPVATKRAERDIELLMGKPDAVENVFQIPPRYGAVAVTGARK